MASNSVIAHEWANKVKHANSGSNFYYVGDTIFSYGQHFPIAVHNNGKILFTLRGYSSTTIKHKGLVSKAISHLPQILCKNPIEAANGYHDSNFNYFELELRTVLDKLKKSTKPISHLQNIKKISDRITDYANHFEIEITESLSNILKESNSENVVELAKEVHKVEQLKLKVKLEQAFPYFQEWLENWRNNVEINYNENQKQVNYYKRQINQNIVWLRVNDSVVETSKGIKIDIETAKIYWKFYKLKAKEGCTDCNYKMKGFSVTRITSKELVVGCHSISIDEINYIANKLKWTNKI